MSIERESGVSRTDTDEIAPVRRGEELDGAAIGTYLRAAIPGLEGEVDILQFPKGSANLTYLVRVGGTELVLRRPPHGRLAPGAHDMAREYRVLSRLGRVYPRAPRALALCEDHAILGASFFVMEYRPGVVVWSTLPPSMAHVPDAGRRVGLAVVDALAELHLVEPASCGLENLGRPEGFVARQVSGWRHRWSLVGAEDGITAMDEAGELLERSLPAPARVSVLHNDLKVDNCQFEPGRPDRVKSVFDWDMATLGDPLIDLGTLLNYWPDPADTPNDRGVYNEGIKNLGLPTRAEVLERYAARTGADLSRIGWYVAFACWKTAVTLQQLYDRYRRGESRDERMAARGARVPELADRALRLLRSADLIDNNPRRCR